MLVFDAAVKAGKGGTFKPVGRKDSRLLTIHADDLADLYVRIAERVSLRAREALIIGANM